MIFDNTITDHACSQRKLSNYIIHHIVVSENETNLFFLKDNQQIDGLALTLILVEALY